MSVTSSTATQQKFTNLRKRLDQLGYRQPLGIESLPLVERLFADLVHTTDSLKKAKLDLTKAPTDKGTVDSHIEAFKSDNARLVKETADLHQQLIKARDEAEVKTKDLKASLRKLEHENADLVFLNNQYVHKIRALEKESKSKTEKILQLQEKNLHAVIQTPGGKKRNIPFRRQRMEMDCPLPPPEPMLPTLPYSKDPYVADLLRVADDNIAKAKTESVALAEERDGLQVKVDSFRKQVESRDAEIDRLTGLLQGGRPYDVVALEARNRSNERLIAHLNIQIDYLQQKNADLQDRLSESENRALSATVASSTLDNRNVELENELQSVDRMAQRLHLDKQSTVKAADREINEAKLELERSRNELHTLDVNLAQLRAEKEGLEERVEELRADLQSQRADTASMQELLQKVQEDKRRLGVRVTKLLNNEKVLVLEIDRLKHNKNGVRKRGKSADPVDVFVRGLEQERDYWKGEVDVLQKMLKYSSRSRANSPSRSPSRSLTRTPSKSRSSSPSRAKSPKTKSSSQEAMIRMLEEERDHFKRECELLKTTRTASPFRTTKSLTVGDDEVAELRRERDELQSLLDKFERHMAEIQANVKVLTGERDKLAGLYENTKEELGKLRRDVIRSPKSPKTSLAAQAVLRRVEAERDEGLASARKLETERDTLRERLKIATETQLADRARLEQRAEDIGAALRVCEKERDESDEKIVAQQRLIDSLEIQAHELQKQLARAEDQLAQQKATSSQMNLLAEQAEKVAKDSQLRLRQRDVELHNMDARSLQQEDRIAELQDTCDRQLQEISRLKSTVSSLDREKDALQMTVDEKTEIIHDMTDRLHVKERQIGDINVNSSELDGKINRLRDLLNSKEHELTSLRRQVDSAHEELGEVGRAREVALRENRRLQDDLATMTRENQRVSVELEEAVQEREDLRDQVQDYIVEVKKTEELLASKERERSDLLEQYRHLSVEADRYETQTHQLESEGSNLRLEMMTKDSEVKRLREKIDALETEVREHLQTERAYEQQVSELSRSLASLEGELRHVEEERHGALQDVVASRDLCVRLEASKDQLQRQLTAKALDYDKLQGVVEDLKAECELLKQQINSERSSVNNLESLLHTNREKEFHTQLTQQELESDNQLLKDRLSLNESKLESLNREISSLHGKCIEYESEIERLRRTLTNEKFERERAVQELRRHGLIAPDRGRLSTNNSFASTSRPSNTSPTRRATSPTRRATSPTRRSTSPLRSTSPARRARSPYD